MSNDWCDFDDGKLIVKRRSDGDKDDAAKRVSDVDELVGGCDWGQTEGDEDQELNGAPGHSEDSSKFIIIYEQYLQDKKSIPQRTKNHGSYAGNPQKELRDWFDGQSDDSDIQFKPHTEKSDANHFVCTLDLPLENHDFTLTSELHRSREDALAEVCLDACRILDECGLLYANQATHASREEQLARKKRVNEAQKEDDIVFDRTSGPTSKRQRADAGTHPEGALTGTSSGVNTYESLMTRWRELNMQILSLKAKLVKLDLSVTKQGHHHHKQQTASDKTDGHPFVASERDKPQGAGEGESGTNANNPSEEQEDDEVDPLDEFMSTLETKTKLSMDDKIERSRIKVQIASYEREQKECARLIEIAKPSKSVARKVGQ